jgi:Uma2 family endonuclease
MATTVLFEEQVEIPLNLRSLAAFRRWATSDDFPERGRIDYVAGRIEVDMSPEDFFCHGTLKTEIVAVLHRRVKEDHLGHLVTDSTRVSSVEADLSAEPDVVFVSHATLDAGRARLIPKAGSEPRRFVELEGAPDLIVEIVNDHSVQKDTQRLPEAYFQAGVSEFWLADARGESLVFRIHARGESSFEPVEPDPEGFQPSAVLARSYRLEGRRDTQGNWAFDLVEKHEHRDETP